MSKNAGIVCGKACYPTKAAIRRDLGRYRKHWEEHWCPPCEAFHLATRRRRHA